MQFLFEYLAQSSFITKLVLLWLFVYAFITLWVFIDRFRVLKGHIETERQSLQNLYNKEKGTLLGRSLIYPYLSFFDSPNKHILEAVVSDVSRLFSKGLTILSIISSTAPFIGLFGTVVGILETFSKMSEGSKATMSVMAPLISEALVATGVGILVAIFAYSFHTQLKRQLFEVISLLESQASVLLSHKE